MPFFYSGKESEYCGNIKEDAIVFDKPPTNGELYANYTMKN